MRFKIHPDFIGKQHCDASGIIPLHAKMSQRVLKELFNKGNNFVLVDETEPKKRRRSDKEDNQGE